MNKPKDTIPTLFNKLRELQSQLPLSKQHQIMETVKQIRDTTYEIATSDAQKTVAIILAKHLSKCESCKSCKLCKIFLETIEIFGQGIFEFEIKQ